MYINTTCPICGDNYNTAFPTVVNSFIKNRINTDAQNVLLCHCRNCDFYYFNYRYENADVEKIYSNYRSDAYQQEREQFDKYYTKEFQNTLIDGDIIGRQNMLYNFLEENLSSAEIYGLYNILDFGGGDGSFIPTKLLNNPLTTCFVYDISDQTSIEKVIKLSNYEKCKCYSYELILCTHVLEHVSELSSILNDIKNLCNRDTLVYFEVPNENPVIYNNCTHNVLELHEHINFFSIVSLQKLLTTNNFNIKSINRNSDGNICCLANCFK